MKATSNIVSGFHHLKMAVYHFSSFENEHKGGAASRFLASFRKKIEWIYSQVQTSVIWPETVRNGIKREWESDVFTPNEIARKAVLLVPEQREHIEAIIDKLLEGHQIKYEINEP